MPEEIVVPDRPRIIAIGNPDGPALPALRTPLWSDQYLYQQWPRSGTTWITSATTASVAWNVHSSNTTWTTIGNYVHTGGQGLALGRWVEQIDPIELDPAAAAAVEQQREARRVRTSERDARARVINDRAEALLHRFLTAQQRDDLQARGYFDVVGSAGNRYRLRRGSSGNISPLDEGGFETGRICAHPRLGEYDDGGRYMGELPIGDVLVAQALHLIADEPGFVALANVHRGRVPLLRALELRARELQPA